MIKPNKVFYVWLDYSEETQQAYTVMQFQMVPGWFVFNGDGELPPLSDAITANAFNEALPNYDATITDPNAEKAAVGWLINQLTLKSQKKLVIDAVKFSIPLRYDKIAFFGGLGSFSTFKMNWNNYQGPQIALNDKWYK